MFFNELVPTIFLTIFIHNLYLAIPEGYPAYMWLLTYKIAAVYHSQFFVKLISRHLLFFPWLYGSGGGAVVEATVHDTATVDR